MKKLVLFYVLALTFILAPNHAAATYDCICIAPVGLSNIFSVNL